MRFLPRALIICCSVATGLAASPHRRDYVVHEKRDVLPKHWLRGERVDGGELLPVRIALKQRNLELAHDYLMDVSDPFSKNYGRHWSSQKVADAFSADPASVAAVKGWLTKSGIHHARIQHNRGASHLTFSGTVAEVETLLETEYFEYTHVSGRTVTRSEVYSVPRHIQRHIDFVSPTIAFDVKVGTRSNVLEVSSLAQPMPLSGDVDNVKRSKSGERYNVPEELGDLTNCWNLITPDCIRALYKIPRGRTASPNNSYGIFESTYQAHIPTDLDVFFEAYSPEQVGNRPIFDSVDGGFLNLTGTGLDQYGESSLDLQYSMALVYPQNVTLFQVGDGIQGGSFGNFLDSIDAEYCAGGIDGDWDAIAPDPDPAGYQGPEACGIYSPPKVYSDSYGYNEQDLPAAYAERQCMEYLKLGLQGITFLSASGDHGVAGYNEQCYNTATGRHTNGSYGQFMPNYPTTCPYVTSVGGTEMKVGATVHDVETGLNTSTTRRSGGGFSFLFDLPDYQADAVKGYLRNNPPPFPDERWTNNASKIMRAHPDVAANGHNYNIVVEGQFVPVNGTSASSPVFGAMITLVNEARLAVGKSTVGFINPVLYAHPEIFTDIPTGSGYGCSTLGFPPAVGWDPITGLGTVNFEKMLAVFLSLP